MSNDQSSMPNSEPSVDDLLASTNLPQQNNIPFSNITDLEATAGLVHSNELSLPENVTNTTQQPKNIHSSLPTNQLDIPPVVSKTNFSDIFLTPSLPSTVLASEMPLNAAPLSNDYSMHQTLPLDTVPIPDHSVAVSKQDEPSVEIPQLSGDFQTSTSQSSAQDNITVKQLPLPNPIVAPPTSNSSISSVTQQLPLPNPSIIAPSTSNTQQPSCVAPLSVPATPQQSGKDPLIPPAPPAVSQQLKTLNPVAAMPTQHLTPTTTNTGNIMAQQKTSPIAGQKPANNSLIPASSQGLSSPQLSVLTQKLSTTQSASTAPLQTQTDASLLALLQSNLPQLNQMRENLRTLIQSSLLLQSLKNAAANATPTQSPSKQQPSKATSSPMGTSTTSNLVSGVGAGSSLQKLVSIPESVGSSLAKGTLTSPGVLPTGGSSRKPVLAQVIGKTRTPQKEQSSPTININTKQLLTPSPPAQSPSTKSPAKMVPIPLVKPIIKGSTISKISSSKSKLASKIVEKELNFGRNVLQPSSIAAVSPLSMILGDKDVVKPVEQEPMDIDVGETPPSLDLPPHLKDHSYCIYNPTVPATPRPIPEFIPTIPQERLSYAPEVPDSPRTLHKLLKILPKKANGTTAIKPKTNSTKYIGTPSNRPLRRPPHFSSKKRKFSVTKKHTDSGDEEVTPDQSDSEGSSSMRRRSQRNAGQRKHYIDDVELSLSDEEAYDQIMQPPLKKSGYFSIVQEEEESDYDESNVLSGVGYVKEKKQKKAINVNPTEGFSYSDIYLDAPPEEANIVEKILLHRLRSLEEQERTQFGDVEIEEFLVKYKNYSYLHVEWATMEKLLKGDKRFEGKVKRYKTKLSAQGIFANIDNEFFNPEYTEVDRVLDVAVQTESSGESVVHYLVKWKSLPYEDSTWELEEDVDPTAIEIFKKLNHPPTDEEIEYIKRPPPNRFKPIKEATDYKGDNQLRPYQLEGLNWLLFNYYTRQNCILADEMGLGKTVQSIVFLLEVINCGIRGPFLVVCPLSTIGNWHREFMTWSDMNTIIYHGSAYSRRMIHEYDLYFRDAEGKVISDGYKFNVLVTTYDVLLTDNSELLNILWRVAIFDEAHRLKNKNCKMLEGLKEMHMEHRVLLTGTPLQNNVEELFSLLNFLEPSKFSSLPLFLQQFGELKTEDQVDELKGLLKPMMLRRLKVDVEKSLAPKEETIIEVELTAIQKQYYRAILERNFSFLNKGSNVPSLLNTMMELRKCCNHPYLINGAEVKIVHDFQLRYAERDISDALIQASGKLVLVDKLLPKLKENGHKVLIFSQMVRCLDILEDYLRMKRFFYERIDGQVRGTLRQAAIDRFSKPDSDRFVFLLCTRAGGLGINLTAADTVIIYDSDWNPQNDIQAQARCHRIGQNKMVKVYRLITHNSYEREMFDKASLKLGLDKAVLQTMNSQQQSSGNPQLNKMEIENLLKKGAYGLVMDDDEAADKFCEEDIDQILERRTQVIQLASEGKGSTFSKASFVSDDVGDITLDDPNFWKKWAEKANLDLEKLAKKDTLVVDEPRVRRQVRRYGDELLETVIDMEDAHEEITDIIPSRGKKGWTKLECFKTEKGLLIYGWGEWNRILNSGRFKKRALLIKDIENIARTMLVYCLHHFTGDEKIKVYIHKMIDPSEITEDYSDNSGKKGLFSSFTEDDYLALLAKDPESLFQDISYMKHLRRHSTRILLRVRQLHVIRWAIMKPYMEKIKIGTPASKLGLVSPKPEEDPPVPWWDANCDLSLLVAIVKHGYEQFRQWRSDLTLCFNELVGEAPPKPKKSKRKGKQGSSKTPSKGSNVNVDGDSDGDDNDFLDDDEELDDDSEGEGIAGSSTPSTPRTPLAAVSTRKTRSSTVIATPTQLSLVWPSLAEINTRSRRIVNAYFKQRRKEEYRLAQLQKVKEKKEKVAEESRRRELKKAELAQKWSKREEQDFARVVSFFGVEKDKKHSNEYSWTKFRQLASLGKKSDERLTLYFNDFRKMCERVIRKRSPRIGLSDVNVDVVSEERAIKCLQRIDLLSVVRTEILTHPDFDKLIKLSEISFEVPHWWIPVKHDKDLLIGIAKHGMYRTDHLIYNDPELSFLESIPKSALFTPNPMTDDNVSDPSSSSCGAGPTLSTGSPTQSNITMNDETSDEEDEMMEVDIKYSKALTSTAATNSTPVPLGWPKEKALVIRVSRITYAFRNKAWPKPMEGLDLFNPVTKLANESDSLSPTPPPSNMTNEPWDDEDDDGDEDDYYEEEEEEDGASNSDDLEMDEEGIDDIVGTKHKGNSNLTLKIKTRNTTPRDSNTTSTSSANRGGKPDTPASSSSSRFQVQKQHGLKLTFRKSAGKVTTRQQQLQQQKAEPIEYKVKIPLVMLQFQSSKGLKRIPRKKSLDKGIIVWMSIMHLNIVQTCHIKMR